MSPICQRGGEKMLKQMTLISTLAVLVFSLIATHASALFMTLTASDNYIRPGETVEIAVWANDVFDAFPGDEVLAFGFDFANSAPSVMQTNFATVGPGFHDDSAFFSNTDVAGSAFPGKTDNKIHLATINCTALDLGISTIGITSDITDLNEGLVYFMAGHIAIPSNGVSINVVPEPGTLVLLLSGIVGLGELKRRKKIR